MNEEPKANAPTPKQTCEHRPSEWNGSYCEKCAELADIRDAEAELAKAQEQAD